MKLFYLFSLKNRF